MGKSSILLAAGMALLGALAAARGEERPDYWVSAGATREATTKACKAAHLGALCNEPTGGCAKQWGSFAAVVIKGIGVLAAAGEGPSPQESDSRALTHCTNFAKGNGVSHAACNVFFRFQGQCGYFATGAACPGGLKLLTTKTPWTCVKQASGAKTKKPAGKKPVELPAAGMPQYPLEEPQ